jgi:RNA polymerase sigma factor (sigma-70 family)
MGDGGTLTEPARRAEPDAVLIRRSWHEPDRFADVFDRHYDGIHAFATRRLGAGLADDVASETFLIAFDRRRRYDVAQPSARPWLLGIAANLIARHHRAETRRYRAFARAAVLDTAEGHADRIVHSVALRATLAKALLEIERRDREVLLLVAWAGLTPDEAARALDIPAGTARSRLHRARRRTRAALGEDET